MAHGCHTKVSCVFSWSLSTVRLCDIYLRVESPRRRYVDYLRKQVAVVSILAVACVFHWRKFDRAEGSLPSAALSMAKLRCAVLSRVMLLLQGHGAKNILAA